MLAALVSNVLVFIYITFTLTIVYLVLPLEASGDQIALQVISRQDRSLCSLHSLRSLRSLLSFLMYLYLLYPTFTPTIVYLILLLEACGGQIALQAT